MDARKQFLADLAVTSRDAWLRLGKQFFDHEVHVETLNTVYRFLDGICYRVTDKGKTARRRGGAEGLRLLGWLTSDANGAPVLSLYARRGAPAVLWRPQQTGAEAFMLTSSFVALAKSHRDEREEPESSRRGSATRVVDPQSVARLFVAPMKKAV